MNRHTHQVRAVVAARVAAVMTSIAGAASTHAQVFTLNLDPVTELARGAVNGLNVTTPVQGFELRVLHEGRDVYAQAFGAWTVGTIAAADSSSKTLSGALIMSLTENSVRPFSLNTRLVELIPAFSGGKAGITIRQCFAHFSGLRDSSAVADPTLTLQQAALQIAGEPLRFVPGTVFDYGGTSMHAAGAAAEVAGGASWNELFQARIAGPLGLSATRFVLTTPSNPRIAAGCESNGAEFARFMEMLRRGGLHGTTRVLSQASVDAMFTRQPPVGIPINFSPVNGSSDYGVGVWLGERDATTGALLGALAAGARGFSSWIDFDDRLVGVFATDLTSSTNIQPLLTLLGDAAALAARNPVLAADATLDGAVERPDLVILADNYRGRDRLFVQGDANGDGAVNHQDLALAQVNYFDPSRFLSQWRSVASGAGLCCVDYNVDGELDFSDIELFVSSYNAGTLGACAPGADLNGDGEIDFSDVEAVLSLLNAGC